MSAAGEIQIRVAGAEAIARFISLDDVQVTGWICLLQHTGLTLK